MNGIEDLARWTKDINQAVIDLSARLLAAEKRIARLTEDLELLMARFNAQDKMQRWKLPSTGSIKFGPVLNDAKPAPMSSTEDKEEIVEDLIDACKVMRQAMRDYEMEVECDPTPRHIDMMKKVDAAIEKAMAAIGGNREYLVSWRWIKWICNPSTVHAKLCALESNKCTEKTCPLVKVLRKE